MKYDEYYQVENYFGEPYPELIEFFSNHKYRGKLLDLGCGQGRNAISLARIGYETIGIDSSKVGIKQLNTIAFKERLPLKGIVADIYKFENFAAFDFILLDSMFHFGKKEKDKEIGLLKKVFESAKTGCLIIICIQNIKAKINILYSAIKAYMKLKCINEVDLEYKFEDKQSNHSSITKYKMIILQK